MTMDLDALAASYESGPGIRCSVCEFIESQDEPAAWDALLAGRRTSVAVFAVMRKFGYQRQTEQPVSDHRRKGHRRG